jgi:aspartyl-tRNA(Asn)/glutamyl-tRNA(Gln) amidotransferase subunit A
MPDLIELTATEAVQALRKGEISSREITQAYLERIEVLEPTINAYITQTPDLALKQADESDRRLVDWRKDPSGPLPRLTGLPLAVKDVLCVACVRCTCGSRILENFVPPYHATVVEKLFSAGAVLLGKTNTDEFAMGSSTENSAYGVSHNPWDTARVPGGSSGGSAAAVAAHLTPLALGTDTGGSVRQPAAHCGITGIKPTYGRVSRYGLVAFGSSLDTVGILGRNAADVALAFQVIAGHDPSDATTLEVPVHEIDIGSNDVLRGLRIGVPQEYFVEGIQAEVAAAVKDAIRTLEAMGARIDSISLPNTDFALPVYYLIAPAEASANLARYDGVRFGPRLEGINLLDMYTTTRGIKFGAEVKRRIMLGTYALSAGYYDAYYAQAQKVRTLIKREFERALESVDIIAAPVTPTTAFRIGEHSDDPLAMYLEDILTIPANLAGIPALTFPVGFDESGLPIGMQLMGPHYREDILLMAAHAYQAATDWHRVRPLL